VVFRRRGESDNDGLEGLSRPPSVTKLGALFRKVRHDSDPPGLTRAEVRTGIDVAVRRSRPRSWERLSSRLVESQDLRDNAMLLGANVLAGIFAYLLHPVLGRLIGVRSYGQVAALIALSFVLLTPTQLVATVAAKYAATTAVSRDFAQLNQFLRRLTVILLPVGLLLAALFGAVSSYVAAFFHLDSREGVVLLGLLFVVSFVTPLNLGILQGLQLFGWYAATTIASALLRLALPVSLVIVGLGVNGAMFGIAMGAVVGYLVSLLPLRDLLRGPTERMGSMRYLWAFALLAAGAAAGIVALFSIDIVLARHYLGPHDAGLYAALATIGRTVLFITSGVALVMFPKVVALRERKEPHARVAVQAVLGALVLAGAIEAVFYIAPSKVVKLLFGEAFAAVATTLPLYGLAMLMLAVSQVLVAYFLAIGKRAVVLVIFLACLLETVLIVWRHDTISHLAQAVLVANVSLLLTLLLIAFGSRSVLRRIPYRHSLPRSAKPT
jgi:O-antigen/teichoic acid export membrane protein